MDFNTVYLTAEELVIIDKLSGTGRGWFSASSLLAGVAIGMLFRAFAIAETAPSFYLSIASAGLFGAAALFLWDAGRQARATALKTVETVISNAATRRRATFHIGEY